MKKILFAFLTITTLAFSGCEKMDFDNSSELRGKTFEYWNGFTGDMSIRMSFTFANDGSVTNRQSIGTLSPFVAEHLRYRLSGSTLTVYHDGSTYWKKNVRNTVYIAGNYRDTYLEIEGNKYEEI